MQSSGSAASPGSKFSAGRAFAGLELGVRGLCWAREERSQCINGGLRVVPELLDALHANLTRIGAMPVWELGDSLHLYCLG